MKRPYHILTVLGLAVLSSLTSCGHDQGKRQSATNTDRTKAVPGNTVFVNRNIRIIISTDINKLGKLLNFKTYKPIKIKFKYTYFDYTGQNKRITVPGPSDYSLEALLYFDSLTFNRLKDVDRHADYPSPNYTRNEFKFDWLDKVILDELEKSDKNYHGHPDFFFGTINGKSWYLEKKILIKKWTN